MKFLAIPNAHALAHVSRLLEIAKLLRNHGHEVLFAGHGKYLRIAGDDGFPTRELPYITVEQVVHAVRTQRLWELYREPELNKFIEYELALYQDFKPDLILLDNRPSARTSAAIAGIKTIAVLNVHMSNYRRIPFFSYEQLAGDLRLPGVELADRLENVIERVVYDKLVMGGLNVVRKKRGLPRLYAYEHEEGDLSLLADLPEFNPVRGELPAHVRFIGPLTWRNTLSAPSCLKRIRRTQPTAYFTLGSEGLDELVAHLGILVEKGIQVVVATGAAHVDENISLPEGVYLEPFVNTNELLPYCDIVCCHGGNGTLYQALSHGLPCVVVSTHAEQHYGGKRIAQLGLGRSMTLKALRRNGMRSLVEQVGQVLGDPTFRRAAEVYAAHLKCWNGPELALESIETYVASSV